MPGFDYGIMEVVNLCGLETIGSPSRKGEQKVKCPFVSGKTFDVNISTSTYKCWHACLNCPGNGKGGLLALYRMCHEGCTSNKDAAEAIRKELFGGLEKGSKEYAKRKLQLQQPKKAIEETSYAKPSTIDKAYRFLLDHLTLKAKHKQGLVRRGMSEEGIKNGMYKSIPENEKEVERLITVLESSGISFDGVPGFYRKNGKLKISLPGYYDKEAKKYYPGSGFLIPSFGKSGKIFSMQIRMDDEYLSHFPEKVAKKRRYIWFTSSGYDSGCRAINHATYGVMDGTEKGKIAYVTEGALKAQVAHDIDVKHRQFVAISGINNKEAFRSLVRVLKKRGVTVLVDAFDMDRYNNENVKNAIDDLYKIAAEEGLPMTAFKWDARFKGIDDYLFHCRNERLQKQALLAAMNG